MGTPFLRRAMAFAGLALSLALAGQSREMRIGLLQDRVVKRAVVMTTKGVSSILCDGRRVGELQANDGLRVEVVPGGMRVRTLSLDIVAKDRVELVPRSADGGFRLKAPDHQLAERKYPGTLQVSAVKGALLMVAALDLEEYVAGVVLSEAGRGHHPEYYKLQSVSCRTYALTNQRKHAADGFQLCDQVHCQVFKGRNFLDSIRTAVAETKGLVAVDPDIRLIQATFHSNCGGETLNAEDVWSKSENYLRATTDTFCLQAPHAQWSRRISRQEWVDYLQRRHKVPKGDEALIASLTEYEPGCRDLYLNNVKPLILLKHVREDWKLNSTFFSIHRDGDHVVFQGRGFGHGVGLCQEGAMGMALAGKSFPEILHHYYAGVHLVDLGLLEFFRDQGQ